MRDLIGWADRWEARQWGVEGSGGYDRGLAQELVHAGEKVYEVNPRLTAQARRRSRRRDKSDRLDARAVAAAVLREEDELPMVTEGDEEAVALEVLTRERERVKSQVDRLRNQLHNRLFQADPAYGEKFPSLSKLERVKELEEFVLQDASLVGRARAAAVRRVASALRLMIEQEGEQHAVPDRPHAVALRRRGTAVHRAQDGGRKELARGGARPQAPHCRDNLAHLAGTPRTTIAWNIRLT